MSIKTARHRNRKEPRHDRRRYWGILSILGIVAFTLGAVVTLAAGIWPQHNERFATVPRAPYVNSYDPIYLAEHGLPPNSAHANVLPQTPEVRSITVYEGHVELRGAGRTIRSIETSEPVENIYRLMQIIDDPAWIEETSSGRLVLKTALITKYVGLSIGSPYVSEVRMLDMPSVFIGTHGGTLDFDGVTITSTPTDAQGSEYFQPFVMATDNAALHAHNSRFTHLGWDWNASYGVSWEVNSTGTVVDSTFEHNFIGVYTGESHGIVFRDSTFRYNELYGLDPHTNSSKLVIDGVLAEHNGAHGIIFSDNVSDSVIMNSTSRNNGENGIMMDKHSSGNRIQNNTVTGNTGDGLVTAASPRNTFVMNKVDNNRVGIRLDQGDASHTTLVGNQITYNGLDAEGVTLGSANVSRNNGGQMDWRATTRIWLVVIGVILLTAILLKPWNRRQVLRRQAFEQRHPELTAVG